MVVLASKMISTGSENDPIKPAWENVVLKDQPPETEVRPEILRSWYRSKEIGLDPFSNRPPARISGAKLKELFADNRMLIELARPVMEMIEIMVRGTGFVVTLAERDGRVLVVLGEEGILKLAHRNFYVPGCQRDIEHAGTNAIGLSIEEDKPIQLTGCEHYRVKHHDWTCSSAPIHDSNGDLIGVVTLSGPYTGRHQHTLAMATAAANTIETRFRERRLDQELQRLHNMLTSIFNSMSDGVVALDEELGISDMNQTALKMLGVRKKDILGEKFDKSLGPDDILLSALNTHSCVSGLEAAFGSGRGRKPSYICKVDPILNPEGLVNGHLITLSQKEAAINLAKKIGGNYAKYEFEDICGSTEILMKQIDLAKIAAKTSSRILITGESGTGKELFAQAIHNYSTRRKGPFVAISCATIPRDLVESELFGYRPGAFTGARREGMTGKFEIANKGTLFLDEINALPLEIQAKLLRALQQNEITRLGDSQSIPVDVRVIAATNRDLYEEVRSSDFREDLYYRLNVIEITIPPLRDRMEDLEILVERFVQRLCGDMRIDPPAIEEEVMETLRAYHWPGNVRELENCIERAIVLSEGKTISKQVLPKRMFEETVRVCEGPTTLLRGYKEMIEAALKRTNGNVSQAARELKIARSTLYRKMDELGIPRAI